MQRANEYAHTYKILCRSPILTWPCFVCILFFHFILSSNNCFWSKKTHHLKSENSIEKVFHELETHSPEYFRLATAATVIRTAQSKQHQYQHQQQRRQKKQQLKPTTITVKLKTSMAACRKHTTNAMST